MEVGGGGRHGAQHRGVRGACGGRRRAVRENCAQNCAELRHNCARIARRTSQRVLQQVSELRVAVRDMLLRLAAAGRQRRDDQAERGERLVDRDRLLPPQHVVARRFEPFGAGEVDEVGPRHHLAAALALVGHRQREREDGVRARRRGVDRGGGDDAVLLRLRHQLLQLGRREDAALGEPLHVDAARLRPPQLELGAALRLEQVVEPLVVQLGVRDEDARALVHRRALEQLAPKPRDDAGLVGRAEHRVRLARPRLPVRENGAVVPVEERLHRLRDERVVHRVLRLLRPERAVEREDGALVAGLDRTGAAVDRDDGRALAAPRRPAAHGDLQRLLLRGHRR